MTELLVCGTLGFAPDSIPQLESKTETVATDPSGRQLSRGSSVGSDQYVLLSLSLLTIIEDFAERTRRSDST